MPQRSKQNQSLTGSVPDPLQIASSNATLNTFLGGRTHSWMTRGSSIVTNPRPAAPVAPSNSRKRNKKRKASDTAPPTQNDNDVERDNILPVQSPEQPPGTRETTRAPTVLPSPALTDAPSPNGSNQVDSANPDSSAHVETVGPGWPVSNSNMRQGDLTHVATNPNQLNNAPAAFAQAESSFPQQARNAEIATSSTVANPTTATQPLQRSNVWFGAGNVQHSSAEPSRPNPRVRSRPSVDSEPSEHRDKRPRVQGRSSPELTFNQKLCRDWFKSIERRVEYVSRAGLLNDNVEKPRYRILGEACQNEDFFYVALHQALCAWTLNKEPVHHLFDGLMAPNTLDRAFEIIQTIVRRNDNMSAVHLQWFANFPTSIAEFSRVFPHTTSAAEISAFLIQMIQHWQALLQSVQARKYPLLAYEMIHVLQCRPRGLQCMLFTMSRRTLSVNDGPAAHAMNEIYEQDRLDEITYEARGERHEALRVRREAVAMRYRQVILASQPRIPPNTISSPVVGQNSPVLEQNWQQPAARSPLATTASSHAANTTAPPVSLPNFDVLAARVSTGGPGATSPMPINQALPQGSRSLQGARRPNHLHIQTETQAVPPIPAPSNQSPLAQIHPLPRSSSAGSPVMLQQTRALQSNGQVRTPVLPSSNLLPQRRASSFAFPPPTFPSPGFPSAHGTNAHSPPMHPHSPGFQQVRGQAQMTYPHHAQAVQSPRHLPIYPPTSPPRSASASENLNYAAQMTAPPAVPYQVPVTANNSRQPVPPVQHMSETEYPPSPYGQESLRVGLHQIDVRSPRRVPSHPGKDRFYQFVKQLVYEPMHLEPSIGLRSLPFTVPEDYIRRLTKKNEGTGFPFCYYAEGSYRYRLRMCMQPETQPAPTESDWVITATSWPSHIFFQLNKKHLEIRRKQHFNKDQPLELTDFLHEGDNFLRFSYPPGNQNMTPGYRYFMAIEIVETISHDAVCNVVRSIRRFPPGETMAKIQRRLRPSDSDDIIIEDETLSISLADPFSATRFLEPVRGLQCKHLECFDLETWLHTRPSKPPQKGGGPQQKGDEPSMVDVWKCPICSLDARPVSLWIDEYFSGVRQSLVSNGDMQTKSITVTANGRWAPVLDADDTDDDSTPAPRPRNTVNGNAGKQPSTSAVSVVPDVIEILDDDD
ncbi:unnamed protein product [Fusarium graminearum]|uniref:SP-RING-type domain-containing protein n=1 Tax=Gibberella zeae TaxID=5518 RepID=A0A4U9EHA0_GIBZA|nr:unnamed protein product [Fusarium graminearum]CAG1968112.1 unnamed protein product [Fusarium graminearum]CAG1974150.1 unnamed protein product [Fusarium graminearum]VTO82263.1 unnamed protein product [Fusarium graminearum]